MSNQYRTYQTRLLISDEDDVLLRGYANTVSCAERTLFARLQTGRSIRGLKKEFLLTYGITARQFNALAIQLRGKINSIKERRSGLIKELEHRIKKAKTVLKRTLKQVQGNPAKAHQKKRRLKQLQDRIERLKSDHNSDTVRICFGSRPLFLSQFHLKENGYKTHKEWKQEWQSTRSNQFYAIGSKDETAGCQSCVATVAEDGSITMRLRLPNLPVRCTQTGAIKKKYLTIKGLRFEYGHNVITAVIGRNLSENKTDWQAINYRFIKDISSWRVFATVSIPDIRTRSLKDTGVIGVDINAQHLAVTETDRFGNPVDYSNILCNTYGKTSEQRKAIIGNAIKQIMVFAIERGKSLVIEKLDFQKKKAIIEKQSAGYARMLSALAYTQIQAILRARAFDIGIEVHEVTPAYTSVIGQYKFQDRYGLSRHHASALVIGRRFMGLCERLPGQLHVTLPLSVRNRGRHVWSKWAVVSRMAQAVHEAHRRSGDSRSCLTPTCKDTAQTVILPSVTGGIPVCKSSSKLFG